MKEIPLVFYGSLICQNHVFYNDFCRRVILSFWHCCIVCKFSDWFSVILIIIVIIKLHRQHKFPWLSLSLSLSLSFHLSLHLLLSAGPPNYILCLYSASFWVKSLLNISHFCLASYLSRIYYFYLCLYEHSCLHQWVERRVWECIRQGKMVHCRRWWCLFHHWHRWDCGKRWLLCRGCY